MEKTEEERYIDLKIPPYIHIKTFLEEVLEDVEGEERMETLILGRVHRQISKGGTHDIETFELDFGDTSDESLDKEDF